MAMPVTMGGNRSKWRPNSAAAMNNNPQGVQSVMQPVAPPMAPAMPPRPVAPNPLPSASPGYGPPATNYPGANVQTQPQGQPPAVATRPNIRIPGPPSVPGITASPLPSRGMVDRFAQTPYGQAAGMSPRPQPTAPLNPSAVPKLNMAPAQDAVPQEQAFTGSASGRQPGMGMMSPPQSAQAARASDLRQQTADSKWRMAQSAATPLAPTPPNPFFQPQGRDPQNPSQFDVRNVGPGGGYFVDRGGQTQPRQDTSMARNAMAGQPAQGSQNAGLAMNIPGATQTLNGQVVSDPQRYGQEGVIPGANRGMTPFEGEAQGLSPDAFRVGTGGQPMIPYTPSGVAATDGRTARQTTIANRNARARGVRGSDVAQWRARRSAEMQQGVADGNDAVATAANQGGTPVQPTGQQAAAAPSPVVTAPAPTQEPSSAPNEGNNQYVNPSGSYGYLWRGARDYLNRYYQGGSGASPNFRQYQ